LDRRVVILRDTKNGRDEVVALHSVALDILRACYAEAAKQALQGRSARPTGRVWTGHSLDDTRSLWDAFKSALKAAGADSRYRLHDLRAQFAVALLRQGEDVETVRKALRHKHLVTTTRYLRHVEGHVASAVRRLSFAASQ
jgi:site-specific recombinase XerD